MRSEWIDREGTEVMLQKILTDKILGIGDSLDLDMETLSEDVEMIVAELGQTFIGALDGAITGYLKGRGECNMPTGFNCKGD